MPRPAKVVLTSQRGAPDQRDARPRRWRHLRANAALAEVTGVDPEADQSSRRGRCRRRPGRWVGEHRQAGSVGHVVYVDGLSVGDVGEADALRPCPGEGGFIAITVAVDATTGQAGSTAEVSAAVSPDDP